jgi:hypothetical protein
MVTRPLLPNHIIYYPKFKYCNLHASFQLICRFGEQNDSRDGRGGGERFEF